MKQSKEEIVHALRAAGLRATAPRVAVMVTLETNPHKETSVIMQAVRQEIGAVSPQAIYNILAVLTQAGLIRRIEPADSPALYESRAGDNHHHVVCRLCGTIGDVDCAVGKRPCLTPSDAHGFLLDEAEVTYWGICPSCQDTRGPGFKGQDANNTNRNTNNSDTKEMEHAR